MIPFKKLSYKNRFLRTVPFTIIVFSFYISCHAIYNIIDWEYGFPDRYNRWTAKEDIEKRKIQIIEVPGLIANADGNVFNHVVKDSIAKKYGFKYINLGCIYPGNVFSHYNAVMFKYLEKRNGQRPAGTFSGRIGKCE